MPVAVVGSSSQNAVPPASQPNVIAAGAPLSAVDNTATVTDGSGTVFVNGKAAARNGDKAKTWDYSAPPSPGVGKEIENGSVVASANVFFGD
jgi:hypothetical protein